MPTGKSHVIIFEGESISEFVDVAVLNKRSPLCQSSSASVSVYDLPGTDVIVIVSEEKNLHLFSLITELLEPFISVSSRISTITVQSSAQHKRVLDDDENSICYLRSLNGTLKEVTALEAPNIITGLAAGVSLWRQAKKLTPANNYVAYMEAVVYDSSSTKPLIDLLKRLDIPCADNYTRRFRNESNLYL